MKTVPLTIQQANEFIRKYHRHNAPVQGCRFAIGAEEDGKLVGVAVCGRPVARRLDDGKTLEITRVCTDGTKNATSYLYAACRRIAQAMGYEKIITYTLQTESGASLRAIGATVEAKVRPQPWNNKTRQRRDQPVYTQPKYRWKL